MQKDYIIKMKGISKSFGDKTIHRNITLDIERNKITYIIGPSGTGKTLLLKMLIGLLKADFGSIIYNDEDIMHCSEKEMTNIRKNFGMVFQSSALFDSMNVYNNVAFPLRENDKLHEREIREKVLQVLTSLGLKNDEKLMPSELSGGMKRRVAFARAIVYKPEVILYDEPTTGLDPIMTNVVDSLVTNLQVNNDITSIVVSHDIASITNIANNIYMIYDGEVVYYGDNIDFQTTENIYVSQFRDSNLEGPIEVTG